MLLQRHGLLGDEQRGGVLGRVDPEAGGRSLGAVSVVAGLGIAELGETGLPRSENHVVSQAGESSRAAASPIGRPVAPAVK